MKLLYKVLGTLLGTTTALYLGLYFYGRSLPETHEEAMELEIKAPKARVWKAITDYALMPSWWTDVKAVEEEKRSDGLVVTWNTEKNGQRVGFITTGEITERQLVRKIFDDKGDMPWGGTWTFDLTEVAPDRTLLKITEQGFVRVAFFRALSKLFFKNGETMDHYLKSIQAYLEK